MINIRHDRDSSPNLHVTCDQMNQVSHREGQIMIDRAILIDNIVMVI